MYDVPQIVDEPLLLEPLRKAVLEDAPPAYLRSVKIKLTARCNLRCVMCKYGRGWAPEELPGDRFIQLMPQLAQMGCRKVHFSGGEVLARRDFERIAGRAAEEGLKVTLTSNLTLLTKERAKSLMRHRISSVSTSMDGSNKKLHEEVRGVDGSFERLLRGMGYIAREKERRGRRTRLRVNFVMMRRNYHCYPELIKVAVEHGATEVYPMPVDEKSGQRLRLTKKMIRHYNEEIAPLVREVRQRLKLSTESRFIYPFGRNHLQVVESVQGRYAGGYYQENLCIAPYMHMFIAWDGNVYLCCMTNGRIEPLGNLGSQSVREVFLGEKFQQIRAQMKEQRLASCHACDMFLDENHQLNQNILADTSPIPASA